MFFRKKIKPQFMITIPEPCSEDWEKMHVVDDEHRHCDTCARTLTDFTKMSDDELVLFFKYNNKKLCGRFLKQQIDRPLTPVVEEPHHHSRWKAAILLPLALLSRSANAQQNDSLPVIDTVRIAQNDSLLPDSLLVDEVVADSIPLLTDSVVVVTKRKHKDPEVVITFSGGTHVYGGFTPIERRDICGGIGPTSYPRISPGKVQFWEPLSLVINKFRKPKEIELVETNHNNVTEKDPSEKNEESDRPLVPDAPWYEAILPESLRIRRKG